MVLGQKGVLFLFLPLPQAGTVTLSLEAPLCISSPVTCVGLDGINCKEVIPVACHSQPSPGFLPGQCVFPYVMV